MNGIIDETLFICPLCDGELEYQDTGGCEADGTFEEWLECANCGYTRDLTEKDTEAIYGYY
ncbi:hypothetical protein [Clostridium sp.]|uniref:hypothetical protein n=1 Tax=Clostridium sp. TaxID=1506 RepID=UPI002626D53C|nr:hypothetical protein [Clostridium sp.]